MRSSAPGLLAHPVEQPMSPERNKSKFRARMLESNFEMYPDAKDAAEVLNRSCKKRYGAQCQFANTE